MHKNGFKSVTSLNNMCALKMRVSFIVQCIYGKMDEIIEIDSDSEVIECTGIKINDNIHDDHNTECSSNFSRTECSVTNIEGRLLVFIYLLPILRPCNSYRMLTVTFDHVIGVFFSRMRFIVRSDFYRSCKQLLSPRRTQEVSYFWRYIVKFNGAYLVLK